MSDANSTQMMESVMAALFGQAPAALRDPAAIRQRLQAGQGPLPAEVPWKQVAGGLSAPHQITLTAWREGRVYFINPIPSEGALGEEVGGPEEGPIRRLEPAGEESIDEDRFLALLALGGQAFDPAG